MPRSKRNQPKAAADAANADPGTLADRLRKALPADGLSEQRMFGGTCFMLNGNMIAAASPRGLLVRVGKDAHEQALARPDTRPMEMRGRVMEGYVYVEPASLDESTLRDWMRRALAFVRTLPSKRPRAKPAREKGARR